MSSKSDSWFKAKKYLHFDTPVGLKKSKKIVSSPDKVAIHSFYPLIRYNIEPKKIKKDPVTKKVFFERKKPRPISYSSHMDSKIYAYYASLLLDLYEKKVLDFGLDENILAFRKSIGCNIKFSKKVFDDIKYKSPCVATALDFSGFFDTLDHKKLKNNWCSILNERKLPKDHYNIYKNIISGDFVDKEELYKALGIPKNNSKKGRKRLCEPVGFRNKVRKKGLIKSNSNDFGIPQGTAISALLSNIYMLDFDRKMKFMSELRGGKYYRYCDDMIFIIPKDNSFDVQSWVEYLIDKDTVKINPKKTEVRKFFNNNGRVFCDLPLQYLGFEFDGAHVSIRSSSIARYQDRMRRGFKLAIKTRNKHNRIRMKENKPEEKIYKKKLFSRYTHLGKRNFIRYGLRAADIMDSDTIRGQLKKEWRRFQDEMEKANY